MCLGVCECEFVGKCEGECLGVCECEGECRTVNPIKEDAMIRNEFIGKLIGAKLNPDYINRGEIKFTKDYYDLVSWYDEVTSEKAELRQSHSAMGDAIIKLQAENQIHINERRANDDHLEYLTERGAKLEAKKEALEVENAELQEKLSRFEGKI